MDENSDIRHDAIQTNTSAVVIELNSDDDDEIESSNNFNAFEQTDTDSFHTHHVDHGDDDQYTEQTYPQSDGYEFLQQLKEKYEYNKQKAQYENAQGSADTSNTSESSAAAIATTSSASNGSAEQRSQFESFKKDIQMEVNQSVRNNVTLNDSLKNTDMAEVIETIVKQCTERLQEKYDLIPKNAAYPNQNETDGKPRKKRKHPSKGMPSKGSSKHDIHKKRHKYRFDDDLHFGRPQPKTKHDYRKCKI